MPLAAPLELTETARDPASCTGTRVKLTRQHSKRLREVFGYGRPMQLRGLSGLELDLITEGLLVTVESGHSPYAQVTCTPKGIEYLSDARQSLLASQAVHNSLASRLALHLQAKGKMTWENILLYLSPP